MTELITRVIVSAIILMNIVLSVFGCNPLDVDESAVFGVVSTILLFADHIYNTWKNFNITPEAVTGQTVINALKQGEEFTESLEELIEAYKAFDAEDDEE